MPAYGEPESGQTELFCDPLRTSRYSPCCSGQDRLRVVGRRGLHGVSPINVAGSARAWRRAANKSPCRPSRKGTRRRTGIALLDLHDRGRADTRFIISLRGRANDRPPRPPIPGIQCDPFSISVSDTRQQPFWRQRPPNERWRDGVRASDGRIRCRHRFSQDLFRPPSPAAHERRLPAAGSEVSGSRIARASSPARISKRRMRPSSI